MTRTTPGNHLVTEALIQQLYYLYFVGSALANLFPYNQGKKKPFLNHSQVFLYFTQDPFTQVVFYLPLKLSCIVVSQAAGNFIDQLLNIIL